MKTNKKTIGIFLLLLAVLLTFSSLTVYQIVRRDTDRELRRLRLAQAEELASLEEAYGAKTFDLDFLLSLDRLYAANSLSDADKDALTDILVRAYVEGLGDKYAAYYDPDDYTAILEEQSSRFVGIGVTVFSDTFNGGLVVLDVYPDSPADEAGIIVGDILSSADGISFEGLTKDEAADLVKGEEGTSVTLSYWRGNDIRTVTLTRRSVTEQTVTAEMLDGVGYVHIRHFTKATPTQLAASVDTLVEAGARAFIFDLRDNPGGLVTSIAECLGFLLPDGPIIHVEYQKNSAGNYRYETENGALFRIGAGTRDEVATDCDMARGLSYPVALLVNRNTASAGEVFAAAFRDYAARGEVSARLFGERTYGKGTVQATYRLNGGAAFKFSVATYLPPYSENYDGVGITPDVTVPLAPEFVGTPVELLNAADDAQLQAAFSWLLS